MINFVGNEFKQLIPYQRYCPYSVIYLFYHLFSLSTENPPDRIKLKVQEQPGVLEFKINVVFEK
jgi:hypothetical protein